MGSWLVVLKLKAEERVIFYAKRFIDYYIFLIFAEVIFRSNFVYLNIAEKSYVNTIIIIISIFLHFFFCFIFIQILNLDTKGGAIAMFLTQLCNTFLSSLYINIYEPIPESIFWINKDCFHDLWSYLKISLPSTFLLCAEWWSFEILTIFAITINDRVYNAHVVVFNVYCIVCSFINGFATSTVIMCSDAIGMKNIDVAKKYFKINMIYSILVQSTVAILFYIFHDNVVSLYTDNIEQRNYIDNTIILLSFITVIDQIQYLLNCFTKSCGKMIITCIICLSIFYGVQTILAFVFSHVLNWEIYGIWFSCLISLSLCI
jgi:MATE family multidrug resistance protein